LKQLENIDQFYHICLPLKLNNAHSIFQRFWYAWNPDEKYKWIREMPPDCINEHNSPFGDFIRPYMYIEEMFAAFSVWYRHHKKTDKIMNLIGIRADESLNRFRAIAFGKEMYKGINYTTKLRKGIYCGYPIYDWAIEDIWGCVNKFNFKYNKYYEIAWQGGIGIHSMRVASPFGIKTKQGLSQWSKIEPESWHKLVNRVSGANFGNIYCKTTLLGHNGTQKPKHLSWEQYTVFLLESIGLYCKELLDHYVRKIRISFRHWKRVWGVDKKDIPDYINKQDVIKNGMRDNGTWVQWKRFARCLEKNDFALAGCNYGITKKDREDMYALKYKWGKLLGIQTNTKPMRELHEELFDEKNRISSNEFENAVCKQDSSE
jgi:predicted phosphoadenosine phosphosulfate sulfurtransferase